MGNGEEMAFFFIKKKTENRLFSRILAVFQFWYFLPKTDLLY